MHQPHDRAGVDDAPEQAIAESGKFAPLRADPVVLGDRPCPPAEADGEKWHGG
jgi:hypothetical protein